MTIAGLQTPDGSAVSEDLPQRASYAKKKPPPSRRGPHAAAASSAPTSAAVVVESPVVEEAPVSNVGASDDDDVKDDWDASSDEEAKPSPAAPVDVKDDWDASDEEKPATITVKGEPSPSFVVQVVFTDDSTFSSRRTVERQAQGRHSSSSQGCP